MSKNSKRPQAKKPSSMGVGNTEYMRGMQELRRSSAAGTHKSAKDYRRKPKHRGKGWE